MTDFSLETPFWEKGKTVVGVDEVGRGPLSGPLTVAAVVFPPFTKSINGVTDSKKLTPKQRIDSQTAILDRVQYFSIFSISPKYIDKLGITASLRTAFQKALDNLPQCDHLLIDGNLKFKLKGYPFKNQSAITKGDQLSTTIASASILAKLHRDRFMQQLHHLHPQFDWKNNKGYGTKKHTEALKKLGPTKFHRHSFLGKILNS